MLLRTRKKEFTFVLPLKRKLEELGSNDSSISPPPTKVRLLKSNSCESLGACALPSGDDCELQVKLVSCNPELVEEAEHNISIGNLGRSKRKFESGEDRNTSFHNKLTTLKSNKAGSEEIVAVESDTVLDEFNSYQFWRDPIPDIVLVAAMVYPTRKAILPLREIFKKCQFTNTSHSGLLKKLDEYYNAVNDDQFFEEFVYCLKCAMVVTEKSPNVDRTLDFAAKFCSYLEKAERVENENECDNENQEMNTFVLKIFEFLFKASKVDDQTVRYRSCQLVSRILDHLGEDATIDDYLYNSITESMLDRMQDKYYLVRVHAVCALQRLQDPQNKKCQVIKAYIFHLNHDPNIGVRCAVINCIGGSYVTLPFILHRARDANDLVRRQAYLFVANKVNIRSLSILQREQLLEQGLKDRSERVQSVVKKKLIPKWLEQFNGNVVDFLVAFDVEHSQVDTCIQLLQVIFKEKSCQELVDSFDLCGPNKIITEDKLSAESALYWRCLAQYLQKEGEDTAEILEKFLPDLSPFCEYVRQLYLGNKSAGEEIDMNTQLKQEFIVKQLLELTSVYDLADEVGRCSLTKLIQDILISDVATLGIIPTLVERLVDTMPSVNARLQMLAEVISEIQEPMAQMEVEVSPEEVRRRVIEVAKLRVELNTLQEDMDMAIREKEFLQAQNLKERIKKVEDEIVQLQAQAQTVQKEEVRQPRNDRATFAKCLTIVCQMVQSSTVTTLTPALRSLLDNFILPCVEVNDATVKNLAVCALGLFCLLNKELAKEHILFFFFQLANSATETIQITALKSIFDLLLVYGLSPFQVVDEGKEDKDPFSQLNEEILSNGNMRESTGGRWGDAADGTKSKDTSLISLLTELLDDSSSAIRNTAAEGLCKLLVASHISSPTLISRLILMWYSPITDGDTYLHQVLGVFFPMLTSISRDGLDQVEQAFMPTLRTIFQAPLTSPLVEVDIDNLICFLLELTRSPPQSETGSQGNNIHNNLAITLCNEILSDEDSLDTKVLVKTLSRLEISADDPSQLRTMVGLASKLEKELKEKVCFGYVKKFKSYVINLLGGDAGSTRQSIAPDPSLASQEESMSKTINLSGGNRRRLLLSRNHSQLLDSDGECSRLSTQGNVFLDNESPNSMIAAASPSQSPNKETTLTRDEILGEASTHQSARKSVQKVIVPESPDISDDDNGDDDVPVEEDLDDSDTMVVDVSQEVQPSPHQPLSVRRSRFSFPAQSTASSPYGNEGISEPSKALNKKMALLKIGHQDPSKYVRRSPRIVLNRLSANSIKLATGKAINDSDEETYSVTNSQDRQCIPESSSSKSSRSSTGGKRSKQVGSGATESSEASDSLHIVTSDSQEEFVSVSSGRVTRSSSGRQSRGSSHKKLSTDEDSQDDFWSTPPNRRSSQRLAATTGKKRLPMRSVRKVRS